MEVVSLDKKGRITIPKAHREALGLDPGEALTVAVAEGELRLRPVARPALKVRARRTWGREAFPGAKEAARGDDE